MNPRTNLPGDSAHYFERDCTSAENTMRCPAYRRKRYALFLMRAFCLTAVYILLWDFVPLRFTLAFTVPLFGLYFFGLVGWRYFLEREMQRMREGLS